MKHDEDSKLREALGAWQVNPAPASDFKSAVWGRIATHEAQAAVGVWSRVREWLLVQLPKPAYASALLAATVLAGVLTAKVRADHAQQEYRLELARHYLSSIDPIVMSTHLGR